MRLWERSGEQINLSFGFSRAVASASGHLNDKVLYQPINPPVKVDFGQSNFGQSIFVCCVVVCWCGVLWLLFVVVVVVRVGGVVFGVDHPVSVPSSAGPPKISLSLLVQFWWCFEMYYGLSDCRVKPWGLSGAAGASHDNPRTPNVHI